MLKAIWLCLIAKTPSSSCYITSDVDEHRLTECSILCVRDTYSCTYWHKYCVLCLPLLKCLLICLL